MPIGELLRALSDGPGKPLKLDGLRKLYKTWVEVYLAFNLLMSKLPTEQAQINDVKSKLAEANELIMSLQCIKDVMD